MHVLCPENKQKTERIGYTVKVKTLVTPMVTVLNVCPPHIAICLTGECAVSLSSMRVCILLPDFQFLSCVVDMFYSYSLTTIHYSLCDVLLSVKFQLLRINSTAVSIVSLHLGRKLALPQPTDDYHLPSY